MSKNRWSRERQNAANARHRRARRAAAQATWRRGTVPQYRAVPNDGASHSGEPQGGRTPSGHAEPVARVGIDYVIDYQFCKAAVGFSYDVGTQIMADDSVLPAEWLRPGMRFRLEDGGVATVTALEPPMVWQPLSNERDQDGNVEGRIIGTVKYTGLFPRLDFRAGGETIQTTPAHDFWSVSRGQWAAIESFLPGELLCDMQGHPVAVEWISPVRVEQCDLYGLEVEPCHNYFVGHRGFWTHNGVGNGCSVPKAAVAEAMENGVIRQVGRKAAGVLTKAELNPQHHIFPQAFRQWFANRKINIDKWVIVLDKATHDALHAGGGPGRGGGWWNDTIMRRLLASEAKLGRLLAPAEIEAAGRDLLKSLHLDSLPIVSYLKSM